MTETRTKGLQPIDYKKSFVGFSNQLDKLFQLFYPQENFDGRNYNFKTGIYKGVTVKISSSDIYLELEYEFIKDKPGMGRNQGKQFDSLNVYFQYNASNRTVYMYPRDRDNFPETPYGSELKANYFFLIVQAALNYILQPKEDLN